MRRLTLECPKCARREEVILKATSRIPRCKTCRKKRDIVWDEPGPMGAPGFRVKGLTKRF